MNRQERINRQIKSLRESFPAGSRVELVSVEDPKAPPVGTLGTVVAVDDIGTIHVEWDNGSNLGLVFGIDDCRAVQ